MPTVCCWSAVSEKLPPNRAPTVDVLGVPSSASGGNDVVPAAIGASLTGLTVTASGTTAMLTAVMPPLWAPDTSTPAIACAPERRSTPRVVPVIGTSLEASIRRALRPDGMPLKFTAGRKATSVARDSTRELASLTPVAIAVQVAPPSVE